MPRKYSIAEARSSLSTIVDQAEAGAEVQLTRRGEPVAVVISTRELARLRGGRTSFVQAYKAFLEKHSADDFGAGEDFTTGVRSRTAGRKVVL